MWTGKIPKEKENYNLYWIKLATVLILKIIYRKNWIVCAVEMSKLMYEAAETSSAPDNKTIKNFPFKHLWICDQISWTPFLEANID
jgi:hypothetical protein